MMGSALIAMQVEGGKARPLSTTRTLSSVSNTEYVFHDVML